MLEYPLGHEVWETEASKSVKAADSDGPGTSSSSASWLGYGDWAYQGLQMSTRCFQHLDSIRPRWDQNIV